MPGKCFKGYIVFFIFNPLGLLRLDSLTTNRKVEENRSTGEQNEPTS